MATNFYKKMKVFYDKELVVRVTDKTRFAGSAMIGKAIALSIDLGYDMHDCKVGSFPDNFYFRTPNGVNSKQYPSREALELSVKISAAKRGFEVIDFVEKKESHQHILFPDKGIESVYITRL